MTATEEIKIFEVLNKHLGNVKLAKTATQEVVVALEKNTFDKLEKLSTKKDIYTVEQTSKECFYKVEQLLDSCAVSMNKGFDRLTLCIVGVGAVTTMIVTLAYWLLLVK